MGVTILDIEVLIGAIAVQQRRANAHLHDILPKSLEEVDSACHSSVLPKGYQSVVLLVCYLFVIDEADILLKQGV